ncbi:MAG: hypothetical protein H7Z74_06770 [Anaerolineae bacterium]|nr:hypothetical protein [Gemmatimonadaceae bacterium]
MSKSTKAQSEVESPPTLVCVPGAIPASERPTHFALVTRLLRESGLERTDAPNGFIFRFNAEMFEDVARFVSNERR